MIRTNSTFVGEYQLIFTRRASWVVHNELENDRTPIIGALQSYLEEIPADFEARKPILLAFDMTGGAGRILFAADNPNEESDKFLIVLIVQPPLVDIKTGQLGFLANCNFTAGIFVGENHSLLPMTFEFARGAIPTKRLNFVTNNQGDSYREINNTERLVAGFKHFISVAYSRGGLAFIDLVLFIYHRPGYSTEELLQKKFPASKKEFLVNLQKELILPFQEIKEALYKERGVFAPNVTDLDVFFERVVTESAETAFTNLALYKSEWDTNINPELHKERPYAENIELPLGVSEQLSETKNPNSQNHVNIIIRRGIIALLLMLLTSLFGIAIDRALGAGVLFLTVTVLFVFIYALSVETRTKLIDPRVIIYSVLLSIGLAVLVMFSILFT